MEDNFSQVALLYELSLTNLKHRNPEDIAGNFIRKILARKALNYGAVWLKDSVKDGVMYLSSLFSMPVTWGAVAVSKEEMDGLFGSKNYALKTESLFFGDELEGHFAYFKLLDIGILELYSSNDPLKLCEESVYPLLDVVHQLAASIESGFAFKKLKDEITQRKIAEKYQKNSEEKYRKIIDNIHLGLMEVDNDEKVLFANESFLRLTGYELNDIINKKASDIFVKLDAAEARKRLEEENKNRLDGVSSFYELPIVDKDGNEKWAMISGAPIKDGEDKVIGSVGIHLDITEKKERELSERKLLAKLADQNEKLNEHQRYLKAINDFASRLIDAQGIEPVAKEITENAVEQFGFTHCAVYLMDDDKTRLIQVSSHSTDYHREAIKKPVSIQVGEGIPGHVAQTGIAEMVNDTSKESRYIHNGGGLSELSVPIVSDDEVIGVIDSEHPDKSYYAYEDLETLATIANLTGTKIKNAMIREKRKLVEKALFESESKFRSIIDSALDAVVTIDVVGRVTEWNPHAEVLFGYTKKEALGKALSSMIIPHEYRKAHAEGIKRFRKTGETRVSNKRIEITALHKSGDQFPIELSIKPVTMGGETFFSAFARDITQRKQAEEDMKMALEQQRELNKMKSQFVAMTSHEFRTPLTTIQTNIELLTLRLEQEQLQASENITKSLDRISSEAQRLTVLINEILLMGKIESGSMPFHPIPTRMSKLVREVIDQSFSNQRDGRKVHLELEGKEFEARVDPNIYKHIITNLISNAFKYSPEGDDPELWLIFHKEHLVLQIKDNGMGIPSEDIPNLFNSFFRAMNVGNIQGTGLGLAIVKEFIDLHKGTINVASKVDVGTTFIITQPYWGVTAN